ncbi:MAG: hypothetical protein AAFU75_08610, partial [Planctomycetota bacterium]
MTNFIITTSVLLFTHFLTEAACGVAILCSADTPVPVGSESPAIKPSPRNVVFILADDHRHDALGFMGHQFAETPHLD